MRATTAGHAAAESTTCTPIEKNPTAGFTTNGARSEHGSKAASSARGIDAEAVVGVEVEQQLAERDLVLEQLDAPRDVGCGEVLGDPANRVLGVRVEARVRIGRDRASECGVVGKADTESGK